MSQPNENLALTQETTKKQSKVNGSSNNKNTKGEKLRAGNNQKGKSGAAGKNQPDSFDRTMFKVIYGSNSELQVPNQMTELGGWQVRSQQNSKEMEVLALKRVKSIKETYKIGKVIGKGSSSQVRKAVHRQNSNRCALKLIRKSHIEGFDYLQDLINNEINSLTQIKHPSIIEVYELIHDNQFICIVTQLIENGSLLKHCLKRREQNLEKGMPER